jgi:hypothetical protein
MVEKLLNIETLWNQLIHPQSISSGAQYVTLWKYFSHPSLVMYYFATPPIKLKLGQQIGGQLLIATHLDESLWWANEKHREPVRSYFYYTLLRLLPAMATYIIMQSQTKEYIRFSSSNFTVQDHIPSTARDALTQ